MTDDRIKAFFEREREAVPLLPAPPGRVEELQSLARRRRNRNTTVVSVAAAVVLAVAGTGLVLNVQGAGNRTGQVAGQSTLPSVDGTAVPTTPAAALVPVPAGFVVSSMSFVGGLHGFALGDSPCGGGTCADLVETTDGMVSWHLARQFDAAATTAAGLSGGGRTMRFASSADGWIVGASQVLATHDGGLQWSPVHALAGTQVTALESSGTAVAYATGADSTMWINTTVGGDSWHQVSPLELPPGGTDSITYEHGAVAVVRTNGSHTEVRYSDQRGEHGWAKVALPCAAPTTAALYVLADENNARVICGGRAWKMDPWGHKSTPEGRVEPRGTGTVAPTAITVSDTGVVASFGDGGLVASGDLRSWTEVARGSFGYVGMTNGAQGFALAATPDSQFWATTDTGRTWQAHSFR